MILELTQLVGSFSQRNDDAMESADIQNPEGREEGQEQQLQGEIRLPNAFWSSPSIEELARAQGVESVADATTLFGTWPGDADDGFEESVRYSRHGALP